MDINYIVAVNNEQIFNENIGRSKLYIEYPELFILQKGYDNIPKAYNEASSTADYLCYLHQDVYLPDDWNLEQIENMDFGVVGVAGKKGNEYIGFIQDRGNAWGSSEGLPAEVETLDELLFVINNWSIKNGTFEFDEGVGNHLYCVDLCLQAKQKGLKNFAINAFCQHNSEHGYILPSDFYDSYRYLQKKYKDELPIHTTCTKITNTGVTAIIPVVRKEKVKKCLEAIKGQCDVIAIEDKERIGCPKMVKKLVELTETPLVMFLGDDTIPSPDIVKNALETMKTIKDGWGVVGLNDGSNRPLLPTHWLADKRMLPLLDGVFFNTEYVHNFCDNELGLRSRISEKYAYSYEAKLVHDHPLLNGSEPDKFNKETYKSFERDRQIFESFKKKTGIPIIAICVAYQNSDVPFLEDLMKTTPDTVELNLVRTFQGEANEIRKIKEKDGIKFYDCQYQEFSFSKIKNAAIACVSPEVEWIVMLDADERLLWLDSDWDYILNLPKNVGGVHVTNVSMYKPEKKLFGKRVAVAKVQIFRNNIGVQFNNRVHEQSSKSILKAGYKIVDSPVVISHIGYYKKNGELNDKLLWYTELMIKDLSENFEDPYLLGMLTSHLNDLTEKGMIPNAKQFRDA